MKWDVCNYEQRVKAREIAATVWFDSLDGPDERESLEDRIAAALADERRKALEEAAKVAEVYSDEEACIYIAAAIRDLQEKPI